MRSRIAIYWNLVTLQAKGQLEYRGAVNILFFAKVISFGTGYVVVWLMLHKFNMIKGWSLYEMFFLQSIYMVAYSLSSALFNNPSFHLSAQVASGEFDAILIRPVNHLFYYMFREFSTGYIGNIVTSTAMLVFSWVKLGLGASPVKILFMISVIAGATLIQSSLFIVSAVPSFWFIKGGALNDLILFDSASFIRYPMSAYNRAVQIVITFVIPYAFVNFYPAQYFLGKHDFLCFHPVLQFLTPVVGVIFFAGAYRFWKFGLNHYQSSGS
jgi:ABC-2 type transport system permease protein